VTGVEVSLLLAFVIYFHDRGCDFRAQRVEKLAPEKKLEKQVRHVAEGITRVH
jgi:hypothetical protein